MNQLFFRIKSSKYRALFFGTGTMFLFIIAASFFILVKPATPYASVMNTMKKLEQVRDQREEQVKDYITEAMRTIENVTRAPDTLENFMALKQAFRDHGLESLEYSIAEKRLAKRYGDFIGRQGFYDLFLIDARGIVVYTVKKEADLGSDVTQGDYAGTNISKCFKQALSGRTSFVSYDYYDPSQEVATFIGSAIKDASGQARGVLAIQLSIDAINSMLSDCRKLGYSAEGYLVDPQYRMLTESRFYGQDVILKQLVDTLSAQKALEGEKGCEVIKDYRGVIVLSAYSSIEIGNVRWAILVEIDQDEVILNLSGPEKKMLYKQVVRELDISPLYEKIGQAQKYDEARYRFKQGKKTLLVKVGDLKRASHDELLFTTGVATCTAVSVGGKNKFGYLAHIGPVDKSYGLNLITRKVWLRNRSTDLIEKLLEKIEQHSQPEEIEGLSVGIFALHTKSLPSIVERLMEFGFRSSQIRFVNGPKNGCLTIYYDYITDTNYVRWDSDDDRLQMKPDSEVLKKTKSIGEVIENILNRRINEKQHLVAAP